MELVEEVEKAELLRELGTPWRRDVLPFAAVHAAVLAAAVHLVIQEHINWHLLLLTVAALAAVQVVAVLSSTWSVAARAFFRFVKTSRLQDATHILVHPSDHTLKPEICDIQKSGSERTQGGSAEATRIAFQRLPYSVCQDASTGAIACQLMSYPTNEPLKAYSASTGLSSRDVKQRMADFDDNDITIPPASFRELYIQQITSPIFVFQVFCMILFMLDDYWYFSLFTLGMLLFVERITTLQRLRNLNELQGMRPKPYDIRVYRDRRWERKSTASLVPGDLIALSRTKHAMHKVPADVVVLAGSCVVNEAMLTGEAVPLRKEGVDTLLRDQGTCRLSELPDPKRYCVYAGTTILQTKRVPKGRAVKPKDSSCLCVVVRTGFATQEGTLVRTFLASREQASANTRESLVIILFLLAFAIAAAGYVFYNGLQTGRQLHTLIIECLLILTSVIPPELPLQLSLAITNALKAMGAPSIAITCTEPFRIPMAGRASVVCFDKTGTLTEDEVNMQGLVVPVGGGSYGGGGGGGEAGSNSVDAADEEAEEEEEEEEEGAEEDEDGDGGGEESTRFKMLKPAAIHKARDPKLELFLAACTDVVEVDQELVGDPLEMAVLKSLAWRCTKDGVASRIGSSSVKKLHTFPFSSALKRMSVVCECKGKAAGDVYLVCKGAAEVLRPRLAHVPDDFDKVHMRYAREGKRILALAYRRLSDTDKRAAQSMKRDEAESGLTFAGFVILGSPLKADTRKVTRALLRSSHHLVMITGDAPLTACYVARRVHIASRALRVFAMDDSTGKFIHYAAESDSDSDSEGATQLTAELVARQFETHDICFTGPVVEAVLAEGTLSQLVPYVKVFARTSPKDKTSIVHAYQQLGLSTVMCGDGTNDVGALKVADAGIALVSGGKRVVKKKTKAKKHTNSGLSAREKALRDLERELDAMSQEDRMPKLGDASIAAAFTSKISSCRCVVHLIRQGRATLVVSNQMIQILALNCLINSFCLSILYLEGIKLSDSQMTISGLAIAACMYLVSASRPQRKLSPQRPYASSVTPYFFVSVLLQFAYHVTILLWTIRTAQAVEGHVHFNPDAEDVEFKPGVTNTVVYLFLLSMQACTILISYRGKPFMQSLTENSNLLVIVGGLIFLAVLGATGAFPGINEMFDVVDLPVTVSETLVKAMCADAVGAFIIDRVSVWLFPASYPVLPSTPQAPPASA